MRVLIFGTQKDLSDLWATHLRRLGADVVSLEGRDAAVQALSDSGFDVIVANLGAGKSEAMSVADYAAYRHPETQVVFVTNSSFFSDGSLFAMCPNACACLSERTDPKDLAALVEYHGGRAA